MTSKVDERMWTEGQRMQEFFRLKAKEGDLGFAIAYALTLVAHSHRKRSNARSRSNVRPHEDRCLKRGGERRTEPPGF